MRIVKHMCDSSIYAQVLARKKAFIDAVKVTSYHKCETVRHGIHCVFNSCNYESPLKRSNSVHALSPMGRIVKWFSSNVRLVQRSLKHTFRICEEA